MMRPDDALRKELRAEMVDVADWCVPCRANLATLRHLVRRGNVVRLELHPDFNSAGHLTHWHINVIGEGKLDLIMVRFRKKWLAHLKKMRWNKLKKVMDFNRKKVKKRGVLK